MVLGGSKRWTFSETMDIRDFTVCIIRCVYRAELILGTYIVYLSNQGPCPKILAHKSEINVPQCPTGTMDSDGNSQVSASKKWLALAELTGS